MNILVSKEQSYGQGFKSRNEVNEVRVKSEKIGQNRGRTVVRPR